MLGLYPFSGRFVLFLVPFVVLLLGAGLWGLVGLSIGPGRAFAVVTIALVLGYPAVTAARNLMSPPGHEEVRTVLRHIESKWQPGDASTSGFSLNIRSVFTHSAAIATFSGPDGPASTIWPPDRVSRESDYALETHPPLLYVSGRPHTLDDYIREFSSLRGKPRAWLLFSSSWNDEFVRYALDCLGDRLDKVHAERAVAYLYDLSKSAGLPPGTCA